MCNFANEKTLAMSKKEQDILYFISFCIEQYKHEMGMSGSEVMDLFDRNGLLDYLSENYEVLHTQGHRWLIEEMKDYLKRRAS
jgi:hypothetical protein